MSRLPYPVRALIIAGLFLLSTWLFWCFCVQRWSNVFTDWDALGRAIWLGTAIYLGAWFGSPFIWRRMP